MKFAIPAKKFRKMKVFEDIKNDAANNLYNNTDFEDLARMSPKKKGKWFEQIAQEMFEEYGYIVLKPESSDHDRIFKYKSDEDTPDPIFLHNPKTGHKIEIKGSTLWGKGTHFKWQQIRPDQDYNEIVFLAVYPDGIRFFRASKETVVENLVFQDENGNWPYNQHRGKTKNSGCFCFQGFPEQYKWLEEIGV